MFPHNNKNIITNKPSTNHMNFSVIILYNIYLVFNNVYHTYDKKYDFRKKGQDSSFPTHIIVFFIR